MDFENLTGTEKCIINTDFLITAHTHALDVIKKARCAYSVELTLMAEIKKLQEYMESLETMYGSVEAKSLIANYMLGGDK